MKPSWLFSVKNMTYLNNGPYSFEVRENEVLGLTGTSGIGKTQMLRALVDVIIHGGEVSMGGVSSLSYSAPEWRKEVALVPADSAWWRDTVGQHFGDNGPSDFCNTVFDHLGFAKDILGWRVSRLSTGERQRLALVRALRNEPSVLLLDEPCSALDVHFTEIVEKILSEYVMRQKTAIIWVSHDLDQLQRVASQCCRMYQNSLERLLFPS